MSDDIEYMERHLAAIRPFREQHEQTLARATEEFNQATVVEKQRYDEIVKALLQSYRQAKAQAKSRDELIQTHTVHKEASSLAWTNYVQSIQPAIAQQLRKRQQAIETFNEAVKMVDEQFFPGERT